MNNYIDVPESAVESALNWVKNNCRTYISNVGTFIGLEIYYRFFFMNTEKGQKDMARLKTALLFFS